MAKLRFGCLLTLAFLTCAEAQAQDRPTAGLVHNTIDAQALSYECSPAGAEMTCTFIQSAVSRGASPEDLAKVVAAARADYRAGKRHSEEECKAIHNLELTLAGRLPPPDPKAFSEGMAKMTPVAKADLGKSLKTMLDTCRQPTEASYEAFARHSHDVETRKCRVWTTTFTQRFRRVGVDGPWVVIDSPNGLCGAVNVSRFEADKSSSKFGYFWRYYSKKVITNKTGEISPGFSCASLDEREYLFDWRSNERQMGCDYVRFGL